MKSRLAQALTALAMMCAMTTQAMADYPIASHRYLADPSPLVTEDRVYIYASNDDESPLGGGYNIPNIVCISSSDMKNWTDHGIVFEADRDTSWAGKSWAPAAIERDGKTFLYFGNSGANIGVVVGETSIGPFKDVLGKPLIEHGTPGVQPARNMWLFDPGVFIDDDGQAYIYFGGNGDDNVRVAKLNRDMVSIDGEVIKMSAPNFFEAAWVYKIGDTYYFTYSTTPRAEMRIDYMTSKSPTEGFTYGGIVAAQPPLNNNNNHAAEFQFKGKWYHVYHNRIVATEAGIPTGFRRNLGIEEYVHEEDGSIRQVEYTRDGVEQIGHLNPYERVEAETMAAQKGIETEKCESGGMNITDTQQGDWVKVAGVDFGAGASKVTMRTASETRSQVVLRLDDPENGPVIATVHIPSSRDGEKWTNVEANVQGASGVHDLYITFVGDGDQLAKIDWWQFTPAN